MKRIAALIALFGLLLAGCANNSPATSSEGGNSGATTTVKVAHLPSTLFAPVYIAQAKGYFTDVGLDVQMEAVKSGQDAVPLLASGKLDALAAGFSAGMLNAKNDGLDFQIVGSMGVNTGDLQNSPTMLIAGQDKFTSGAIAKPADLKGKKIAAAGGPGATGGFLVASILQTAGLGLKDVQIVNLSTPDMPNALKTGAVDAVLASAPISGKIVSDKTGSVIGVPAKGVSSSGLMFGAEFAKSPAAQKFFDALVRAAADLQNDGAKSEENLAILAKATKQDVAVLKSIPSYTFDAKLKPQTDTVKAMEQTWIAGGQITYTKPQDMTKLVNTKFYDNAK